MFFFQGPLHVGTILFCLLAFAGLRHGRLGWGWAAAVVLLAAGALGDFQTVALGMVPAFVGGIVAMARTRDWRRGMATAAAPVAAGVIAAAVRLATQVFGTFSVASANPIAPSNQVPVNLGLIGTWGSHMLGVGGGDVGTGGVPGPLEAAHVLAIAAVLGGVVVAVVALLRGAAAGSTPRSTDESWRVDDLLVLAFAADLAVFVLFTTSGDQTFSRYLTGGVVFGAILAGRAVGRLVDLGGPSLAPAQRRGPRRRRSWACSAPAPCTTSPAPPPGAPMTSSARSSRRITSTMGSATTGARRSPR